MIRRLKDLREDHDKKQKEIAAYLNCDQSLYSKYERGVRDVPVQIVEKLAEFYGVSVDYILGRTDVPEPYPKKKK